MMQRIKRILAFSVTVALIVVLVQYAGYILRPTDTDGSVQSINTFHNLPEQTVEVIGFGSSHMWKGMDSRVLYHDYGIGAYNYGGNWQRGNTTSLFIQDALRTQTPKVILIETFLINSRQFDTDINGEIYYTRAIDEFEGKQRYLKQCFGDDIERYVSYYMPLCAFHDNWVNLSQKSFQGVSDNDRYLKTMGFVGSNKVTPITLPTAEELPQKPLSEATLTELDYISSLCREKGVDIIFYTAPYYSSALYPYTDAMTEYATKNGYQYFNMFALSDETGINGETDFQDAGHLNTSGSQKVASFLGKYISENYELTDMRTLEDSIWRRVLSE